MSGGMRGAVFLKKSLRNSRTDVDVRHALIDAFTLDANVFHQSARMRILDTPGRRVLSGTITNPSGYLVLLDNRFGFEEDLGAGEAC
jgi:hypothetical protein